MQTPMYLFRYTHIHTYMHTCTYTYAYKNIYMYTYFFASFPRGLGEARVPSSTVSPCPLRRFRVQKESVGRRLRASCNSSSSFSIFSEGRVRRFAVAKKPKPRTLTHKIMENPTASGSSLVASKATC